MIDVLIDLQEVKRNNVFKAQVDLYKKQLLDSQTKCTEETKRADKAEFESKRTQEKFTALQREKEVCLERDMFKKDLCLKEVWKEMYFE